jgi:predicted transcriptional regulator
MADNGVATVSFQLDPEAAEDLRWLAEFEERTVSAIIRSAIGPEIARARRIRPKLEAES